MVDLVTFGETMLRLSPRGNDRLELASELEFRAAGAESNVAACAQRLGVDAVWLSKLPDTPLGRKVTTALRRHGVDVRVTWSEEGRQGVYYLEQAGSPRGVNVIYDRADAAVTTATPADLDLAAVDEAAALYVSGITPALSATLAETTDEVLDRARAHGTTTVLDVNYRAKLWTPAEARETFEELLPRIDVLVTAERDAREVLAREGRPAEIAAGLADEFGCETTVVTRGADGLVAWVEGELHEQGAFPAETCDPIGTGDALVGGYLARRLQGDSAADALEYGAATAALKRTIPGDVAAVTPGEVERVVEAGGAEISR